MGLFVKKSDVGGSTNLYTTSSNRNMLVVGLGNIGREYSGTRHNIGFECIDMFAKQQDFVPWTTKKDLKTDITSAVIGGVRVILVKPNTFMNNSGEAVQAVAHFYKISPSNIVVVHDELDIDFGKIRTSVDGSAAGHNGIKSVIEHMGEKFGRIRVGIGPKKPTRMDSADFVLAKFSDKEQKDLADIQKEVASMLIEFTAAGSLFIETRNVIF